MCSINHEKKAIFINIPKTGRTYISDTLVKYYGFRLYLNECTNHTEKYGKRSILDNACLFANDIDGIYRYYKNSKYLNELMGMDEKKWQEYYKFCFVRNPYSRIVSGYFFNHNIIKKKLQSQLPLNENITCSETEFHNIFKRKIYSNYAKLHMFLPQSFHMIDENDKIIMDYIGRFENLENDFCKILKILGFDIIHEPEIINKGDYNDYKTYYINNEIINSVNECYEKDFENFNYKKIHDTKELKNL